MPVSRSRRATCKRFVWPGLRAPTAAGAASPAHSGVDRDRPGPGAAATFFATLKTELVYARAWPSRYELESEPRFETKIKYGK